MKFVCMNTRLVRTTEVIDYGLLRGVCVCLYVITVVYILLSTLSLLIMGQEKVCFSLRLVSKNRLDTVRL